MNSNDHRTLVVGAGLAGLSAAAELAHSGPVTVVERLPAPGGQAGFESTVVQDLYNQCLAAGVQFVLGSTALRWSERRLLVVGPSATVWLEGEWLVYAGGSRPATVAELGLVGGRLAGVFSAAVAHHLLDARIKLGRRPVVAGHSDWVDIILRQLRRFDVRTTLVGAETAPAADLRQWPGYHPIEVHGLDRVQRVVISNDQSLRQIACDALILAGDLRPLRNVDGAIRDNASRASFIQPTEPGMSPRAIVGLVRAEAARVHTEMGATD